MTRAGCSRFHQEQELPTEVQGQSPVEIHGVPLPKVSALQISLEPDLRLDA